MSVGPFLSPPSPATSMPTFPANLVEAQFATANHYASQAFALAFDSIANIEDNLQEVEYATLLTWLISAITNASTGLSTSAQQDLWDFETEKDTLALMLAKDSKAQDWAKGGWLLPDGVLEFSLADLDKQYLDKRMDKSREIRVRVEDLTIANTHFAVTQYSNIVTAYAGMIEKGAEAIAATASQLAAGALSAAHAQASVGFDGRYSIDNQISSSIDMQATHSTKYDADAKG